MISFLNKNTKTFFPLLLWLGLSFYIGIFFKESLLSAERHQLFRFATDYFSFFSPKVYTVLLYIQAFFTQFYIYPLLGGLVVGGLLCLGYISIVKIIKHPLAGLIWVAAVLPSFAYWNLIYIILWLFVFLGGLPLLKIKKDIYRYIYIAFILIVLSFILHENIIVAALFYTILELVRSRSFKKTSFTIVAAVCGCLIGIGLIYFYSYPFIYKEYLSHFTLLKGNLGLVLEFPAFAFLLPPFLKYYSLIGVGIIILLPLLGLCKKIYVLEYLGIILIGMAVVVNYSYNRNNFYKIDRLCGEYNFKEAIEQSSLLLKYGKFYSPGEEGYAAESLKISLLAERKASDRLFSYTNSVYLPILFPEVIIYSFSSYNMAAYYTHSGLYAEAMHLLYDFVTTHRVSKVVLEKLLYNSIIVKDYEPCQKFIGFFKQSLFNKDIAKKYEAYLSDTAALDNIAEIAAARERLSEVNYMVLAYNPDDNMHFRGKYETDNPYIYEYCLALWMVYKNPQKILEELPKIRQFYPSLPHYIQEAVLACFPPERVEESPLDISTEKIEHYKAFNKAYGLYQNGYLSFSKLKKKFNNTYWFHLYFNTFRPIEEAKQNNRNSLN